MAGRRLKDLPDDGSARTELARHLRQLKARAGAPTYEEIAKRTGYSRTALSGLFNGQLPSRQLLHDVVEGLGGDPQPCLRLLDQAQREEESTPSLAEELQQAHAQIAALKLTIVNPHGAALWADLKMGAANERMHGAQAVERGILDLLTRVKVETQLLIEKSEETERRCEELTATAMSQATLTEERAHLAATATIREAEGSASRLLESALEQAERIKSDATVYASGLHARAGRHVDELLREADAVAGDARRDAEKLKVRARIEVQRLVRDAQDALNRAGQSQSALLLDQLLTDFGIGDINPADGQSGRHRRTALPPPTSRPELTP
ncbi:helix-turn-helix domain-containing protein [Streptomyces alboflavus]|uniref:helix-turn-helix domain-containing protein n=1 Tax=Streptomyces alboflavus TaxID=67267 RepID=UPI0036879200